MQLILQGRGALSGTVRDYERKHKVRSAMEFLQKAPNWWLAAYADRYEASIRAFKSTALDHVEAALLLYALDAQQTTSDNDNNAMAEDLCWAELLAVPSLLFLAVSCETLSRKGLAKYQVCPGQSVFDIDAVQSWLTFRGAQYDVEHKGCLANYLIRIRQHAELLHPHPQDDA